MDNMPPSSPHSAGKFNSPSGTISLYEKNASTPIYSTVLASMSGVITPTLRSLSNPGEQGGYTGIQKIRIFTPTGGNPVTRYLGISEVAIY
jgi:hypothetical protein